MSLFELVHTDVWGPCIVPPNMGFRYFVTFVDDYSKSTWRYLMKSRDCLRYFVPYCPIQNLRSDNAKEYFSNGIIHQSSCIATPKQNSVVERKNCHLLEVAGALMFEMNVPKSFGLMMFTLLPFL